MGAIPFHNNATFNGFEIQNFKFQNLAVPPATPGVGQPYADTANNNALMYWDGTSWLNLSAGGSAITALTGDVSASGPGSAAATVNSVGGATAANVADAATKRHTQNTDTGTSATNFQLDTGNSGPKLKNSGGAVQLRNSADNAFANLQANDGSFNGNVTITGDLTVNGTTTTLNTATMETGDNMILLNSEITGSAGNTDGGIALKRLKADNVTRNDVQLYYSAADDRWYAQFGPVANANADLRVAMVYSANVGDGSATTIDVTHNLNTRDVAIEVYQAGSPYQKAYPDIQHLSTTQVRLIFGAAPAANEFRVVVTG